PRDWFQMLYYGAPYSLVLASPLQIGVMGAIHRGIERMSSASGHFQAVVLTESISLMVGAVLTAIAGLVTIWASSDENSQGLAIALWTILGLLMSPVAWPDELPLLLPIYLFTGLIAWRLYFGMSKVISSFWFVGGVVLVCGIGIHDFTSILPGVHPRFMALILVYVGAAMVLHSRNLAGGADSAIA
ncbi:MAG TPA: hypothetical protein VMT58_10085, partial [Candidatus Binataceae bacterium]|nr:hypothetical protein [Candidatus Binataceae bacterium]